MYGCYFTVYKYAFEGVTHIVTYAFEGVTYIVTYAIESMTYSEIQIARGRRAGGSGAGATELEGGLAGKRKGAWRTGKQRSCGSLR